MMKKHMRLMVVAIAALLVLTIGLTATAFAWGSTGDEGTGDDGPMQTFIGKVAGALGLEEEVVADAFSQAGLEMREEAREQRLQEAVGNGLITEGEADQIREWWQSRPEAMDDLGLRGRFQMRNLLRHRMMLGPERGF